MSEEQCEASTWRGPRPQKPKYENLYGPGGFNRCVFPAGHHGHAPR